VTERFAVSVAARSGPGRGDGSGDQEQRQYRGDEHVVFPAAGRFT
jgi:hypothetical protein